MIDTSAITELTGMPLWLLTIYLIWEFVWKGLGMWKAAKRNSSIWFVALLLFNTAGILSILYIYLFSEMKLGHPKVTGKKKAPRKKKTKRKSK
jgi:hypothetical protein|tara:strand:- start:1220 stop:1498 length:279 start_codon:yes stop_codon:yes gene_type:complete